MLRHVLGSLDAVVVAFETVAVGGVGDEFAVQLVAVGFRAPAAFLHAAFRIPEPGAAIAGVTGVVAERPQPWRAHCSAFTAALSAWLDAERRETRDFGVQVLEVLEVRPRYLDAGSCDRPVVGTAPPLPLGGEPRLVAGAVVHAHAQGAELVRTTPAGALVVERRVR